MRCCCFVVVVVVVVVFAVVVVVVLVLLVVVACHRRFLPATSPEPRVIPTAVLSILCVILQIQLSLVVNLLNVFVVWLPIFLL